MSIQPGYLLIGEASGYQGCRISGIPFTSERLIMEGVVPRLPHEGAEAYAARVARQRPDLGSAVTSLCRQYSSLRYAAPSTAVTLGQFEAGVRGFRPRPSGK